MKESLRKLMEAQEIDSRIDALNRARKDYPEELKRLKNQIEVLSSEVADLEAKQLELKKKQLMIEEDIVAERETRAKKDKRLLETKTNKEYTAVQHEIVSARERIDALETENLEIMTATDELLPKLDDRKQTFTSTTEENTAKIRDIQEKYDSIESDIAALVAKRERALSDVDDRVLHVYKRLRTGKSGLAVAKVDHKKYSCTGCFKQLPPQKVLEVRKSSRLIFCESCGRVLVWDDTEEQE